MFPALEGGFLTTGPPGKSLPEFFIRELPTQRLQRQFHPKFNIYFKKIFIYLAALGLSCSTWDLRCRVQDLYLWHVGSFSCSMRALSCGLQDLVP